MGVTEWAVVIGAIGTVLLQILGRLQAWQLAVIAARTEAQAKVNQFLITQKVGVVEKLVDGTTTRLTEQVTALGKDNAKLREEIAAFVSRDETTAQHAREAKAP